MDNELREYLEAMERRIKEEVQTTKAELREEIQASAKHGQALLDGVKESLEREIRDVRDRVDRLGARLDKIAAGAHYVTRLVEWSEKQDKFQEDILLRLQTLEARERLAGWEDLKRRVEKLEHPEGSK